MPTPFPKEFRRDVIAVARQGGQSIAQVARSFGISESCLARWLQIADRDDARGGSAAPAAGGGDLEAEIWAAPADQAAGAGERDSPSATAYLARDVLPK